MLRRALPVVAAIIAVEVCIGILVRDPAISHLAAFVVGFAVAIPVCLWIAEPGHVRHWWLGAEGERATEAELRKLGDTWTWRNGIELGHGDIDHLVTGPAGMFVLETKFLAGKVSLVDGQLTRTQEELPDRPEPWGWVRGATIRKAIEASGWSAEGGGQREFVRAVVVIWGDFKQGLVEEEHITYVHGSRLVEWLESRPGRRGRAQAAT